MPTLTAQPLIEHFIRSRLFWFGKIGRQDIVSTFSVGTAYASRLLGKIKRDLPVHESGKALVMPIMPITTSKGGTCGSPPEGVSSQRFLSDLYCASIMQTDPTAQCGDDIPHMSMDAFRKHVPENILRPIVRSLQDHGVLEIEYIGMNVGDEVKRRTIEPIRLVNVAGRWHINAHCQSAKAPRDFVLSRILSVRQISRNVPVDPMLDFAHAAASVHVYVAHPLLSDQQKEVVWREFGMKDGKLEVDLSDSELFYFEQQYVATGKEKPPFKLLVRA